MASISNKFHEALMLAGEVAAETLWPTRCAVCDRLGLVLCDSCLEKLVHIDWWRACPRCGAPFGRVQCSECNDIVLARFGRTSLPFVGCVSAVEFDERSSRIARVYKDQGERRLADVMTALMCFVLPPEWRIDAVTFVPAAKAAYRKRGFDHGELLARMVADKLGKPCFAVLSRPKTRDQRKLNRLQRYVNVAKGFNVLSGASPPTNLLLVDDVYTTGSTLCAATDALVQSGVRNVYCSTFARVF